MIAEPLVAVRCTVCGSGKQRLICPAHEVRAHLKYLQAFHRRRLRPYPDGRPARTALADRAEFTQHEATDIVACRRCGLLFRSPRPSDQAVAQAYARDEYGRERLASLFEAQVELYRTQARRLRDSLGTGPNVRVVEVGSFVGGFLAAGKRYGWTMLGVDPGEEVGAFCRERGLPILTGTMDEAPIEPGSVACVAIWNTFDQLPDPAPTLAAARRALRSGGLVALRVPNGDCFRWSAAWARRLAEPLGGWLRAAMAWNNLLAFPYLYGYTVPTLDWLLGRHGLTRTTAQPDTLPRLADTQTRPWAAWEERALKSLCRLAARVEALRPGSRLPLAPWFDAYYRVTSSPPD